MFLVSRKTSGFFWTNISEFDFNGGTPTQEQNVENASGFRLLRKEIEIVKPDIAVFLIGKKYDQDLEKSLSCKWGQFDEGGLLSVLTGIVDYPVPLIFKKMHPTYLCRIRKNKEVLDQMVNIVSRHEFE